MIVVFKNNDVYGQFVFPKDVLAKKGILRTAEKKGKMAMRVYASWDEPTSKQAIATQKWQQPYFFEWQQQEDINERWKVLYHLG
ncbi:MepB family protein [Kurthia senegalensis]|uniref:MepB family protein n=1 Tax=Kurthia senegalensis TaxID=1033740 RepID=UPI000287D118